MSKSLDIGAYYGALVREHGGTPAGGHWVSEEEAAGQYTFWARTIGAYSEEFRCYTSVLDFGCGTGVGGSCYREDVGHKRWTGCDLCREALDYTPYPAFLGDHTALRPASVDWVLAMGCFNIGYRRFYDIVRICNSLWGICRVCMAVSFARSDFGDREITGHPLHKWLQWAERHAQRYVLRADWSAYSSLLVLWKGKV